MDIMRKESEVDRCVDHEAQLLPQIQVELPKFDYPVELDKSTQQQPTSEDYYGDQTNSDDEDYEGFSDCDLEGEDILDELESACVSDEEFSHSRVVQKAREVIKRCKKRLTSSRRQEREELKRQFPRYGDAEEGVQEAHSASEDSSEDFDYDIDGADSDNPGQLFPPPFDSDDEDYVPEKYTEIWYNPDWDVPYFSIGMRFVDHHQFKEAMEKYAIKRCYAIHCSKGDTGRQKYVCRDDCHWDIFASWDENDGSFRIKTYTTKHSCHREYQSKLATEE